jgi:hypothetical protein
MISADGRDPPSVNPNAATTTAGRKKARMNNAFTCFCGRGT